MTKERTLDVNKARKAGNYTAQIETSGAYVGIFTEVRFVKPPWGGEALEFSFQTIDGLKADYISVPTKDEKNDVIESGDNMANALLMCAGLQDHSRVQTTGKVWDGKAMVDGQIEISPELISVPIGVVLEKKLYTKKNGNTGVSWRMVTCFNSTTKQTAKEIDEGTDAAAVDDILKTLSDKDNRKVAPATQKPDTSEPATFDDDIPF